MSEFKGTPGPWFIADDALGNMTHIVLSKQYPFEMVSEENLALITAAPELLQELMALTKMLDDAGCEAATVKSHQIITKALGK
ncbi:TPA: hypothetical protein ACPFO5_001627 [Citrobacter freundii]|uniref:hypothetical protein n=1 Tax=Citrobacter freundii TaxID=546 RepID=UPI0029400DDB|nr:hypothetical protein [Citrobacter freundii]HED1561565.1 hypothetical protein [Citrobacter freundii]HED3110346.1 hypothetical protein [Citrobacter freundii]HED3115922.1 hypothetical protein [Citrobacter freundii]